MSKPLMIYILTIIWDIINDIHVRAQTKAAMLYVLQVGALSYS